MAVVSIVMPVYNGEKYLRQSIASVLNQTFQDWNLIIVDDCSTDSSLEIMNEYVKADDRIQVIHNEVNSKIPASLNNGFEKAAGRYYTWTSDDNIYEQDAIEKMVKYLDEHPDTGLVYSNMRFIDGEGRETGIYESDPEDIFSNNCVGACFMYRADIAKKAGKYSAEWFLVEDYEYWLRIRNISMIGHIDELLYKYRRHEKSLSETRMIQVREKLYDLRLNMIQRMNNKISCRIKTELFKEMWLQNSQRHDELLKVFWNGEMPVDLQWLKRKGIIDMDKKVVLFGAGVFGAKALDYLGEEKVYCYVDNNPELKDKIVNGKIVKSFDDMNELAKTYQIVIAVDAHKAGILAEQLENAGITEYITYLELVNNYKKPELSGQVDWIKTTERAKNWIINNSIKGEGIINNSRYKKSYPEVSGYYIPTLLRWGFRDLAVTYAEWLCSIQHEEGAWYDTDDKEPYVFDTAQILKGLVDIYPIKPEVKDSLIKGCEWLLGQITEEGRLVTPSKAAWGNDGVCSELIHLYCLSPLIDAAKLLDKPVYEKAARKVADYYISNYRDEILNFAFLSHFYSYVMEALCDIGETELAKEAMEKAGKTVAPVYFYMVASPAEEEDYLKGIEDVIGRVPFFGGSAADNTVSGDWSIFTNDKVFSDGCAVAFFYTDKPMANVYTGAYHETTNSGVITKIEGKRTLVEIDGVPAMKKYAEWTGKKLKDLAGGNLLSQTILAPLGVKDRLGDLVAIRHPMNGNDDYSMNIGNNLAVNTAVIQMEATVDELIDSTGKALKEAKKNLKQDVGAYLLVHCGGRKLGIGDRIDEVAKQLQKEANGVPFMTIFTFGEYGSKEHGANTCGGLMLSFTAIGK